MSFSVDNPDIPEIFSAAIWKQSAITDDRGISIMVPPSMLEKDVNSVEPTFIRETDHSLKVSDEESHETRIERLGRQRPEKFKTLGAEIGFVFSIVMSQVMTEYFVSGFSVLLPTLSVDLDIPEPSRTWPASVFSLIVAAFLLIFGRLADMYGGYPLYVGGTIWLAIWSLIAGFSRNALMLDFCRALQGLGPAAFLPSSVMLLGSVYRPGPRKNLVFAIYGSCAPFGFFVGIFFAGLIGQYTIWGAYFWVGTALTVITGVTAALTIPSDMKERRGLGIKMDWPGAILSSSGLIIFTYSIVDSSHAPEQWNTPYIYVLFIIGSLLLIAAAYVEFYVVANPLLPYSFFQVPRMPALIVGLFFNYGSLGIFLIYATFYMEQIMGASPLRVVAWYVPFALGGCIIGTFGGFVMHLLPGTVLIIIGGTAFVVAPLLFAVAPVGASYWAFVFPLMICGTVGIDITFTVANVFITTSLPKKQQGLAGAVIMLLLNLGIAVFLGFADIVNTYTLPNLGVRKSYQAVFWFEVACAAASLITFVLFVRLKKAESAMTADELAEAEIQGHAALQHGKIKGGAPALET